MIAKFGGLDASLMKRMKELEEENRRLKKMYAAERLKAEIHKEALEGKLWSHPTVYVHTTLKALNNFSSYGIIAP